MGNQGAELELTRPACLHPGAQPRLGCFLATNPVSTAEAATSRPQSGGRCTLARACSGGRVAASLQGSLQASVSLAPAAERSCLHSFPWLQLNHNTGCVILSEDPGPV